MNAGKKLIVIMVTLFLINTLCGCELIDTSHVGMGKQDNLEDIEDNKENEEPTYGGSITIPMMGEDNMLSLTTSSKDVIDVCGLIYEGLVGLDDKLRPAPALAESWRSSEDGRIWNFKLRENVKWHDGVDFSIQDVLFTIDVLRFGGYDSYYAKKFNRIDTIKTIRAIDRDTLYVELTQPVSFFLDSFTFPIIPRHIFESSEQGQYIKSQTSAPIGTGPYRLDLETYNLAEGFTLIRNEEYWSERPYIDKIEVKVYDDSSQILNDFHEREIDVLDTNIVFAGTYAKSDDVILYRYLTSVYEFLAINHRNHIFDDLNVRKALAFGIDRKSIIKMAYLNNAEAVDAPICPESWLFHSSSRIYDCDIDAAIELLEESGWHDTDGDGIRDQVIDGEKVDLVFKLVTNRENDLRKDVAESIRAQLMDAENKLGIHIDVELLSWEEIIDTVIPNGDFDLLLTGHHMSEMPNLDVIFGSGGSHNFMGYSSPELDELIVTAKHASGDENIRSAYRDIQRYFIEELPVISLYFPTNSVIISKDIQGKICPRELNLYRDIEKWYIDDEK